MYILYIHINGAERGLFELLKFILYNGEDFDCKLFPEMHDEL